MKIILILAVLAFAQTQTIIAQNSNELLVRAKSSILAGKSEAAIIDLTTIITTAPNNAEAFATRANAHIALKNYVASLADSSRATTILPNYGWAYYLHGFASYWQPVKDLNGSLADFTKVIALDPKLAGEAYRYRADIHNLLGKDYWAAIADATEAVRLNPNDGTAYSHRARAYTQLKNYRTAREDYQQSIKVGFATSAVYKSLGFVENQLKNYDQAAIHTRKAIELDPKNEEAKKNLVIILASQEEQRKSGATLFGDDDALDRWMKVLDDLEAEKNAEAQTLFDKGDYAGVLAFLKPDEYGRYRPKSWEIRSAANFKLKKYDEALVDINKSFNSNMTRAASQYLLRGDIYKAKYEYVAAEKDFRAALKLAPNDATIVQRLSSLQIKGTVAGGPTPKPTLTPGATIVPLSAKDEDAFLNDDPSARAANSYWDIANYEDVHFNASASIKKRPTATMHFLRAAATMELLDEDPMLYDLDDALKDVNTSIELSSRDLGGKYALRGDIYVGLKDLPKALESYTKSIEANPSNYRPYLERAKIYLAKGYENWAKAVADLTKVVEKEKTKTEAYNLRGYALFRLDKKADSAADFKKVLSIDPNNKYAKYNVDALANDRKVLSIEEFQKLQKAPKTYYV